MVQVIQISWKWEVSRCDSIQRSVMEFPHHCNLYESKPETRIYQMYLKGTPQELKRLANIAFVRSGIEYASIILDPHFIKDSDALERV